MLRCLAASQVCGFITISDAPICGVLIIFCDVKLSLLLLFGVQAAGLSIHRIRIQESLIKGVFHDAAFPMNDALSTAGRLSLTCPFICFDQESRASPPRRTRK